MQNHKEITSVGNALVKKAVLLREKSRERKKSGFFIMEGKREIQLALKSDYQIDTLFYRPELLDEIELKELTSVSQHPPSLISVSEEVYKKIAYRETTEGIIALVRHKNHSIEGFSTKNENPLILVAEAPEKPGNIGALLRTADAANLDGVIIANPKTDIYNPNIIRSSVGCVFSNQIAMGSTTEIIDFLKQKKIDIYCAALTASINYSTADFTKSAAIVVGTEATGLSKEWLENSSQNIIIPMQGEIDSMNVSVSAGILIFEAKRQRGF